ncbi:MAG: DMT family protein [Planctomycetota bacterium]
MPVLLQTTLLLICSNVFMTFAWYAQLGTGWATVRGSAAGTT